MFVLLANLIVLGAVAACVRIGFQHGLCKAAIGAAAAFVAVVGAVILFEPLGGLLTALLQGALGGAVPADGPLQSWMLFLAFALVFGGIMGLAWWRIAPIIEESELPVMPLADKAGGAACGGLGGILVVGAGLVMWSMVPFLSGLKLPADRLFLDPGRMVLWAGGRFAGDVHVDQAGNARSLVLLGEPPSRESVRSSRLSSEPWHDFDEDSTCTEADLYSDVDGNGSFTRDLYYEDLDGNLVRRIGLVEKYVISRWDDALTVNERDRPPPPAPKPAAPPVPKPAPPPGPKPAPPPAPPGTPPTAAPTAPAQPNAPPETTPVPAPAGSPPAPSGAGTQEPPPNQPAQPLPTP